MRVEVPEKSLGALVMGILDVILGISGFVWSLVFLMLSLGNGVPALVLVNLILGLILSPLMIATGIGLAMNKHWGGLMGVILGSLGSIRVIYGLIVGLIIFSKAKSLPWIGLGPTALGYTLLISSVLIGLIFWVVQIVVGVNVLRQRQKVIVMDDPTGPSPLPSYGNDQENKTQQYARPKGVKQVALKPYVKGQPQPEQVIVLHDEFGNPVKTRIGRGSSNEMIINCNSVSSEHCMITEDGHGNMMVCDVGSTHGTHILRNGATIKTSGPTAIYDNDRILLGAYAQLLVTEYQPAGNAVIINA
jgi:pSer/pThr/pTyr-binding forkhead associated (FHA) protein